MRQGSRSKFGLPVIGAVLGLMGESWARSDKIASRWQTFVWLAIA